MSGRKPSYINNANYRKSKIKESMGNNDFPFYKLYEKKAQILTVSLIGASILVLNAIGNGLSEDVIAQKSITNITDSKETVQEIDDVNDFVKISERGLPYTDDARDVWKKLSTYNFHNDGKKVVYLTFDDGPSPTNTPVVLDILAKHSVRATFFVTGQGLEKNKELSKTLLKHSFEYGNSIGNHSYSHDYNTLYPNRTLDFSAFKEEIEKTDNLLKEAIGSNFQTKIVRCPGGFYSWKGMDKLEEYFNSTKRASIDWNALNKDSEGRKKNADELVQEAINSSKGKNLVVLLMHDSAGKEETAKALPEIIKYYKQNGYEFRTLS